VKFCQVTVFFGDPGKEVEGRELRDPTKYGDILPHPTNWKLFI
jgi:hypothetical protein